MANLIQKRQIILGGRRASLAKSIAQAHFDRVLADNGIVPGGYDPLLERVDRLISSYGNNFSARVATHTHDHVVGVKVGNGTGPTAGRAALKVYDLMGAAGDQEQTNLTAQPLLLVHTGQNYVWTPGENNNHFTTPNAAGNNITGNLGIEVNAQFLTTASFNNLYVSKGGSSVANAQYHFGFNSSGNLQLMISNGTTFFTYNSTAVRDLTASGYRVSRNSTTGVIRFFQNLPNIGWVQLGVDFAGFTGSAVSTSNPLTLGTSPFGAVRAIYNSVRIYNNDTFTNPTQVFNPSDYNRAVSQTTMTSSATGEVWTLNTPNTNNALKAAIVDQTMRMGNGTTMGTRAAGLTLTGEAFTGYTVFRKFVNTGGGQILNELGADTLFNQGKYLGINFTASQEEFGFRANIGPNSSRFSQTSFDLKVATYINNIANANESLPYLINNVSQSFQTKDVTSDNTAALTATGYNQLARNNAASLFANAILAADLQVYGEDDTATRTAINNMLLTSCKII